MIIILIATQADSAIETEPKLKPKIYVGFIVVNGTYILLWAKFMYVWMHYMYTNENSHNILCGVSFTFSVPATTRTDLTKRKPKS